MVESNRVEFKKELNDSLEKEVVGFLNYSEGGEIYIGIADNGAVTGVENSDDIQRRIVDRIKNNIYPSTMGLFDVITANMGAKDVVKIIISSGPEKPYYIKKYGMSPNGCLIRVGTTVQQMTMEMIDSLYSKRIRNSLGKLLSPRQDLTFKQLKIYYEENGYDLNDKFLSNLELYTEEGKFNYAAYLLADENGISMKVAKYSGVDKVDLIENAEFGYCSLIKATENTLNKLDIENVTKTEITSTVRKEKRLVDPTALREAVINAIIHNDYSNGIPPVFEIFSDRFVITSSGGLPQELSQEEFFEGISAPRNKELMRVFKDVKLVEQLGSGVQRILKIYDKSIFKFSPNFLKVSFPIKNVGDNVGEKTIKLNKTQKNILSLIKQNNYITQAEISIKLNKTTRTIERNMKKLQEENIIVRVGSDAAGYWKIV
ncbi:RNA-binding domain-containing protein [Lutispora sp.]|uniref:RNA-binding domain-containing protein n=1 Tax=Lutispora sp. TaxID=2828727 RepID=UPI002B210041|nr:RNA-binding domain-containing protein [Lutispora sp.]MEA4960073.1 putative DNA binding domain-containing protein [Lutispora sp.]